MSEDKKNPWPKVIKLFLEFLIAAITAFFAASCVRYGLPLL